MPDNSASSCFRCDFSWPMLSMGRCLSRAILMYLAYKRRMRCLRYPNYMKQDSACSCARLMEEIESTQNRVQTSRTELLNLNDPK